MGHEISMGFMFFFHGFECFFFLNIMDFNGFEWICRMDFSGFM